MATISRTHSQSRERNRRESGVRRVYIVCGRKTANGLAFLRAMQNLSQRRCINALTPIKRLAETIIIIIIALNAALNYVRDAALWCWCAFEIYVSPSADLHPAATDLHFTTHALSDAIISDADVQEN
jgi:hypothetical protein